MSNQAGKKAKSDSVGPDADIRRLEVDISGKLGAKVKIAHTKKGAGKLVINYNSLDDEIVAGERRWRAAQMAGLADIPAVIRDIGDDAAIATALIENIQRENLNPLEEARALERLIREFNLTHQEGADAVGRSRAAVSNLLRLLDLSDKVKPMLESRQLEMGHARALLSISDKTQQFDAARQVVKKGLSVRETEQLVRRVLSNQAGKKAKSDSVGPDADIRRLEVDISGKLGAKVKIAHTKKGAGKLVINYNSLDELDGILKHIK